MSNVYYPVTGLSGDTPAALGCRGYYFGQPADPFDLPTYYPMAAKPDDGRGMWSGLTVYSDPDEYIPGFVTTGGSSASRWFMLEGDPAWAIPGYSTLASVEFSFHMQARKPRSTLRLDVEYSAPGGDSGEYNLVECRFNEYAGLHSPSDGASPYYPHTWSNRLYHTVYKAPVLGKPSYAVEPSQLTLSGIPEAVFRYTAGLYLTIWSGDPGGWVKATVTLE